MATKKPKPLDEQARGQRKLTKTQLVALQFIALDVVTYKLIPRPVWMPRKSASVNADVVQVMHGPFDLDITARVNRMRKRGLIERKRNVEGWPRFAVSPLGKAVLAKEQGNLT